MGLGPLLHAASKTSSMLKSNSRFSELRAKKADRQTDRQDGDWLEFPGNSTTFFSHLQSTLGMKNHLKQLISYKVSLIAIANLFSFGASMFNAFDLSIGFVVKLLGSIGTNDSKNSFMPSQFEDSAEYRRRVSTV